MYAVPRQQRIGSAVAAGAVTAAMGWALLNGLAGAAVRDKVAETLAAFQVIPPPPPKKVVPKQATSRPSGRAAPANIRSQATPVVAPPPLVLTPLPPPPIVAAPKPFEGNQATQGAAPVAGPGTGAGGVGDGTGSGGWGDGDGNGIGDETPPRWRKGRLSDSDYPIRAGEDGFEGTVSVRFLVWTDGRVRDCAIDKSSGNRLLDDTTCRLIRQRFRYDPSRDAAGRPVPAWILENHTWSIEAAPEER